MIIAWTDSDHYGEVLEKVKGCLFLGVPHRGADLAYWANLPAHIVPYVSLGFAGNPRFVDSLKKNSREWVRITNDFVPRSKQLQCIRSFFETDKLGDIIVSLTASPSLFSLSPWLTRVGCG